MERPKNEKTKNLKRGKRRLQHRYSKPSGFHNKLVKKETNCETWYCSVLLCLEDMSDFWLGHRERGKWKNSELTFSYT